MSKKNAWSLLISIRGTTKYPQSLIRNAHANRERFTYCIEDCINFGRFLILKQ